MGVRLTSQTRLIKDALRRAPIFANWPPAALQSLEVASELWRYRKGETIVERGDPARGMWLVVGGSVSSFRRYGSSRYMLIGILWPGDVTGLLSTIDGGSMPESASARTDVLLIFIPRTALEFAMQDNACFRSLALALSFRARNTNEALYLQATDSLRCQVAKYLVYLPRRSSLKMSTGTPRSATWIDPAPVDVTQSELAAMLGVARQTVNRVMMEFLRKRIVARDGESIRVIDFRGLLAVMEEDEPLPDIWRDEILSWDETTRDKKITGLRSSKTASPESAGPQ